MGKSYKLTLPVLVLLMQVALHDKDEAPLVSEKSVGVTPGYHFLLETKLTEVRQFFNQFLSHKLYFLSNILPYFLHFYLLFFPSPPAFLLPVPLSPFYLSPAVPLSRSLTLYSSHPILPFPPLSSLPFNLRFPFLLKA